MGGRFVGGDGRREMLRDTHDRSLRVTLLSGFTPHWSLATCRRRSRRRGSFLPPSRSNTGCGFGLGFRRCSCSCFLFSLLLLPSSFFGLLLSLLFQSFLLGFYTGFALRFSFFLFFFALSFCFLLALSPSWSGRRAWLHDTSWFCGAWRWRGKLGSYRANTTAPAAKCFRGACRGFRD